ncbi:MAG TPA: hypothetical protein VNW15_12460 [Rhizomicrobium sp.]|jgi:hypothetical protein|nr:hypothetical protein [Rhizomicrobium sp.]
MSASGSAKRKFSPVLAAIAPGSAAVIALLLFLAACAAKPPPPPPPAAPVVPIPAAPPRIEPPSFTALSPEALRARLGAPAFSRKDGPTEMWRYDARACRAFFFFTGNQVNHVETIPRGPDNAADPACLTALRKAS